MITLPTFSDLSARIKSNFAKEFNESSPFTKNSFLGTILDSIAGEFYQYYLKIDYMTRQLFVVTADKDYIRLHGQHIIDDLSATVSQGRVFVGGVLGTVLPIGSILTMPNNMRYITTTTGTITTQTLTPTWLSSCNGLVTIQTPNHDLIDGEYTISGASNGVFNGTFAMRVLDKHTLTFEIADTKTYTENPSTTSALLGVNRAIVEAQSIETGLDRNLQQGSILSLEVVVGGIDDTIVLYDGFVGGNDDETVEEYRTRLLKAIRSPRTPFSYSHITAVVTEEFREVTRLFIREQFPAFNSITLYGMNDTNGIPISGVDMQPIRDRVAEFRPVNLPDVAIVADELVLTTVNIDLSNVKPQSIGLNETIKANLTLFCKNLSLGQTVSKDKVNSVILQTVDYSTGVRVETFDNSLVADVPIDPDKLATFNISFS